MTTARFSPITPTATLMRLDLHLPSHLPLVFAFALLLGGIGTGAGAQAQPAAYPLTVGDDRGGIAEIGQPRPALEVNALDGTLVNDARVHGRALIVDFFATWCQPCHRALADLLAARTSPGSARVPMLLIDLGEPESVVRQWAATAALPDDVIVALDPRSAAARRWGARRLPTTYIVDARGTIRHINRGWGPGYRDRLHRWLRDVAAPVVPSAP